MTLIPIDDDLQYYFNRKNITVNSLMQHPQLDDINILLKLRQSYWRDMTGSERAFWGGLWSVVHKFKHELKQKHFDTIIEIVESFETPQRKREIAYRIIREHKARTK